MNILIFNLNLYGEWPCGLVNKYLAKVYTLYGIVPPTTVTIEFPYLDYLDASQISRHW